MNQAQRTFLIKKIDEQVKIKIDALRSAIPEAPNLNNYLLHALMSNNFKLRTTEEIGETLRQRALKATGSNDWLGNSWGSASKTDVHFKAAEIFVIPEEYKKLLTEYQATRKALEDEIHEIAIQSDTLKTRIQLASDKTLQTMINEVDDMGNISLMDEKLRLLTIPKSTKQLE
jgi:hypothetical protein